jgi:hypothetical protein
LYEGLSRRLPAWERAEGVKRVPRFLSMTRFEKEDSHGAEGR